MATRARKASTRKAPAAKAPAAETRRSKSAVRKKAAARKTPARKAARKKASAKSGAAPRVARRIFAHASPKSLGGVSLFDVDDMIRHDTVGNFASEPALMERCVYRLQEAGFEVIQVSETTINIAGSARTYRDAFGAEIVAEDRPVIKGGAREDVATFMECHNADRPGLLSVRHSKFNDILEGVALEEPRYYMAGESAFAPPLAYWHLDVPGDVSLACNADRAHRGGITGKDIRVAMCDSGWYRHPFFTDRGYRSDTALLGPGASNPDADESGHGTGESANIFAVAPDVHLLPVKMSFVNTTAAFNAAVGLNPDIITNSWGSSKPFGPLSAADQALAAAIAAAVNAGICVVFSAGNGHWGFPGQHPDVISAGGVFLERDGTMRASDYASGFMSTIYAGRRVPDLSGLVGMRPRAIYITLPVEGGDEIDTDLAGGTHPNGDETASNDGWSSFSGTSAAAPQLAGAAALVKQACPRLGPEAIRQILMDTARDVTAGTCHPNTGGNSATVGPDTATGNGLVDAHRAVLSAKLRCLVVTPVPVLPVQPVVPIQPIQPVQPPIMPVQPIRPIRPIQPIQPIGPVVQPSPIPQNNTGSFDAGATEGRAAQPLTEDDIRALEQMVDRGEIDLDDL